MAAKFIALSILITACSSPDRAKDAPPDVQPVVLSPTVPPVANADWYKPTASTTWQWQLSGSINTSYNVNAYDIDLFESDAALIASLHGDGRKVICYFSAGSSEDWRSDFDTIPKSAIGKNLDGWEGEAWLDIRNEGILPVMMARLDLAVSKGCDAVEPDNVDGYANDTGFALSAAQQLAYNKWLANEAHSRGLGIGLKNDGDQIAELLPFFDFSVNEQCHQFVECQPYEAFVAADKPVFNAEYTLTAVAVCAPARAANIRTLILPLGLDDSSRVSCDD